MKKTHYIHSLILALVLFTSCKSSKVARDVTSNLKLSAKQVVKENAKKAANFKTLQSKLKITYTDGAKQQAHTVSYRMQKDEVLWMSAPFGIIRAKITPNEVAFYNKLDNTYFKGDFDYFSKLLGTSLNFQNIQNILLGETLFNLKDNTYKLSLHEGNYALQPKQQQDLYEIFYLLNPSHYKVQSQQLSRFKDQQHLQIDYLDYQNVQEQELPRTIKIIAVKGQDEVKAALEFKSVVLDQELRFPFKIPSGYKKIEL